MRRQKAMRSLQTEVEQPLGGARDIHESCKKSRKDFVLTVKPYGIFI